MREGTTIYDETPDGDTTGGRISRAREAAGLSVKDLAWRLGVRIATIKAWESDRSQPGAHRLTMLSGLLGVSLSWILQGVGTAPVETNPSETEAALADQFDQLKALHVQTGALITRLEADLARLRA